MSFRIHDPHAIDGKLPGPEAVHDVVIVGAGKTGLGAALEAASAGRSVLLIDENPVSGWAVGSDVPLWFGGRATAAVQASERLVEALVEAEPMIADCFEAGVDVQLGTVAWGLWRNRENCGSLPRPLLGLSDGKRAWTIGFETLILATGARDCAVGFAGWDQPGVMGALGFDTLVRRYAAFAGRRIVVLGSGALAQGTVALAQANGIEVAGVVEVGDAAAIDGVPLYAGHRPLRAEGGVDGVERLVIVDAAGSETVLACDTVVVAVDTVPATELAEVAGVAAQGTDGVWLAGAARGADGEDDGRAVVAQALGQRDSVPPVAAAAPGYREGWMRACLGTGPDSTLVCQCEEVSRADLLGVQPPRYLPRGEKIACRSLETLLADGPPDPEQVKRLTRAGMGLCQGRRCREQVSFLLGSAANLGQGNAPRGNWRVPVRPVPLGVMADWSESPEMSAAWDVWFGIPTQWIPYAAIGTEEEARLLANPDGNMHL